MKIIKKILLLIIFIALFLSAGLYYKNRNISNLPVKSDRQKINSIILPSPTQTFILPTIPSEKILQNDYQIFQTFNNCGPASLSMALSYFGIHKSQAELGNDLRPYQNPQGDNDDKSVTLEELGQEAGKFNLLSYVRPQEV